jgi:hypothetical protein
MKNMFTKGAVLQLSAVPNRTFSKVLFLFLFISFFFCHQRQFDSPTPVSRLDLLNSLFEKRSLAIDAFEKNTPDKAVYAGHYYSDKAPGTVALALQFFGVASGLLSLVHVPLRSESGWLFSSWFACAGSLALITSIGAAFLFQWLSLWTSSRATLVTTLALFLGAAPLPYCTMMFSHALVVGLLAIGMWATDRQGQQVHEGRVHEVILFLVEN